MPASQPALVCRGFQMEFICRDAFLVQWNKGKALNVFTLPGPEEAGGSREMVAVSSGSKGSAISIVDIARGDNDIEVRQKLTPGNA